MSGRRLLGLLAALTSVLASFVVIPGPSATADVHWLCGPGVTDDQCRGSLTTTVQHGDGRPDTVVRPLAAHRPGIDCFYVYPTASQQATPNSDGSREASVDAVTRLQAMQFSSRCRVYAPLYRQRTLVALSGEQAFTTAQRGHFYRVAYADVLAAWRDYRRHFNHGRGVVLIGHSQGSRLLRKLIREQIDPHPAARAHLVSAILPGANVLVRRGRDTGGDFRHLRLCHRARQLHCVMAWSTFEDRPPDDTRFGKAPTSNAESPGLALPHGRRYAVACTDPASLARNVRARTHALTRSEMFPGVLGLLILGLYGGPPPSAATPWVVPTDHYTARCTNWNGARVLRLWPVADARKLHPEPNATWGLHLLDVNIVLGDLLRIVGTEANAYHRAQQR